MLCRKCNSIFKEKHRYADSWKPYSFVLSSVTDDLRCDLCVLLHSRFLKASPGVIEKESKPLQRTLSFYLEHDYMWDNNSYYLDFQPSRDDADSSDTAELRLLIIRDPYDFGGSAELGPSTNSIAAYKCAMKWLHQCLQTHEKCGWMVQTNLDNLIRPKRLILTKPVAGKLYPRLCDTTSLPHDINYMTLSHCWGTRPILTLLQANLEDLELQIPLDAIAKTFRDAMFVTASAGIDYLWIDSLCIIQDSEEDWAEESQKMGEIYRNGICNLAATGFTDGSTGLFKERDPSLILPIPLELDSAVEMNGETALPVGSYNLADFDMWTRGVQEAPLNTRAWVTQERFLSPRTIHFGNEQIFWECNEESLSEVYPTGFPSQFNVQTAKLEPKFLLDHDKPPPKPRYIPSRRYRSTFHHRKPEKWETQHMWNSILSNYSAGRLTRQTDKLVAIAGLAKVLQRHMGSRYLSGLWEDCLIDQLPWYVHERAENLEPAQIDAPSWSWVSARGRFSMFGYPVATKYPRSTLDEEEKEEEEQFHPLASIVRVDVPSEHGDFFHIAKGGSITLQGNLGILVSQQRYAEPVSGIDLSRLATTKVDLNIYVDDRDLRYGDQCVLHTVRRKMGFSLEHSSVFFYLPIKVHEDYEVSEPQLCGLLLRPIAGKRGAFQRVGMFNTNTPESVTLLTNLGSTKNMPPRFYTDWNVKDNYTITII